jgi:hypothetical protein
VPLGALELGADSLVGSGFRVPFGFSLLDVRAALGEFSFSDARDRDLRNGEAGRGDGLGTSLSLCLFFPNPLNAELRLVDDFLSGDEARPYGCALLRRLNTVPKRFKPCSPPLCLTS